MGLSLKRIAVLFVCTAASLYGETVPFSKAIDAALKHSGTMAVAAAEEAHARASLAQARDAYIPQVIVGSGLGYSYGFPLTLEGAAPSIVNLTTQSMLLNFPQREYIKSARLQWQAASSQTLDKRNQVVLDTSTAYCQLNVALEKLKSFQQEADAAHKAEFITSQRVDQGVDSQLDLKKAQLNSARARMKIAEIQADIDVLREKLSNLTGIPAAGFETDPQSVPKLNEVNQDTDYTTAAIANSPAVKSADKKAAAEAARAKGEHKAWLPTIDFAAQYARLARFNNYDVYYRNFTPDNAAIGLNIRFPFFVESQRRAADAADADAIKAKKEAEMARDQVREETLKVQRTVAQLAAAVDVARLEYEVSNTGVQAAQGRLESGNANPRDVDNAQVDASERYAAYLDAQLELQKTQMQLMRMTGDIYNWASPEAPTKP